MKKQHRESKVKKERAFLRREKRKRKEKQKWQSKQP